MTLVGAEDVEVFDASNAVEPAVALGMQVEEVLGVAVGIEGAQGLEMIGSIIHPLRTVAVGGGGAGVDESYAALQRPLGEAFGVAKVILHQVAGVGLGGGGACPEVEDGADAPECIGILLKEIEECVGLHVVSEPEGGEVLPLLVAAEEVGDEDVLLTPEVECVDEGAADEAGSAGDEDGCGHGGGSESRIRCLRLSNLLGGGRSRDQVFARA